MKRTSFSNTNNLFTSCQLPCLFMSLFIHTPSHCCNKRRPDRNKEARGGKEEHIYVVTSWQGLYPTVLLLPLSTSQHKGMDKEIGKYGIVELNFHFLHFYEFLERLEYARILRGCLGKKHAAWIRELVYTNTKRETSWTIAMKNTKVEYDNGRQLSLWIAVRIWFLKSIRTYFLFVF